MSIGMAKWILPAVCCIFFAQAAAGDDDFYLQLLQYGTDRDIAEGFARIDPSADLGDRIERLMLRVFDEPHGVQMYLSIVRFIGSRHLEKANQVLIGELDRTSAGEDYLEAVIEALGSLGKAESVEPLKAVYNRKGASDRIRKSVVTAWGDIGDPSIEDVLTGIAQDLNEPIEVRAAAVLALGKAGSRSSLDMLKEMAVNTYEHTPIRRYAVYSLGRIGGAGVLDVLEKLLMDPSHEVAEYAVLGIAGMDSGRKGELLIEALRSDYDKVRFYGARELGKMKYRPALDILAFKSRYDRSDAVRREAEQAVASIQGGQEEPGSVPGGSGQEGM